MTATTTKDPIDCPVIVRASSMPVVYYCGQAAGGGADEIKINPTGIAATAGTAVHKFWAEFVRGGEDKRPSMAALVDEFGIEDQAEFAKLCAFTLHQWATVGEPFDPIRIEDRLQIILLDANGSPTRWLLSGQCDARSDQPADRRIYVFDLKTGWLLANPRPQVGSYALLAYRRAEAAYGKGTIDEVRAAVLHCRHWTVDWHTFTAADLEEFEAEVVRSLRDEAYHPGEHCLHCPRRFTCPARQQMLVQAQTTLLDSGGHTRDIRQLPDFAAAYAKVKMIKDACSDWLGHVREDVAERGQIDVGDGKVLRLVSSARTNFRVWTGIEYLQALLTPEQLDEVLSVRMGPLRAAVKASGGDPKAAWEAFLAAMEHRKAMEISYTHALRITKKPADQGD